MTLKGIKLISFIYSVKSQYIIQDIYTDWLNIESITRTIDAKNLPREDFLVQYG